MILKGAREMADYCRGKALECFWKELERWQIIVEVRPWNVSGRSSRDGRLLSR